MSNIVDSTSLLSITQDIIKKFSVDLRSVSERELQIAFNLIMDGSQGLSLSQRAQHDLVSELIRRKQSNFDEASAGRIVSEFLTSPNYCVAEVNIADFIMMIQAYIDFSGPKQEQVKLIREFISHHENELNAHRWCLADTLRILCTIVNDLEGPAAASPHIFQATEIYRSLVEENPTIIWRSQFVQCLLEMSVVWMSKGGCL